MITVPPDSYTGPLSYTVRISDNTPFERPKKFRKGRYHPGREGSYNPRKSPSLLKVLSLELQSEMGQKEWSPTNVLDVLGDSIARATLVLANEQSVAVKDLATELDVSAPTIYRRIDPLVDANMLKEHQRFDKQGNQHKEYETIVDEITFAISDDGYTIDIQVRHNLIDDFESMWSDLEQANQSADDSTRSLHSDKRRSDIS